MQSKKKIQTQPIEDFVARVRTSKRKQDKTFVMTMADAETLADSLAQTMTRLVGVQEDVIEALKSARESQTINVEMDGGQFKSK
jgi:hypothetical protein